MASLSLRVLRLVLCVGLCGALTSCWVPVGSPAKACGFEFDPPHPVVEPDRWVVDHVPVSCDQVPQWHVLTVYLEYKRSPGDAWQRMDMKVDNRLPDAVGFTVTVRGDCWPGLWRARAEAEGSSGDGIPFTFEDTSQETPIRMMATNHCEQGDP